MAFGDTAAALRLRKSHNSKHNKIRRSTAVKTTHLAGDSVSDWQGEATPRSCLSTLVQASTSRSNPVTRSQNPRWEPNPHVAGLVPYDDIRSGIHPSIIKLTCCRAFSLLVSFSSERRVMAPVFAMHPHGPTSQNGQHSSSSVPPVVASGNAMVERLCQPTLNDKRANMLPLRICPSRLHGLNAQF